MEISEKGIDDGKVSTANQGYTALRFVVRCPMKPGAVNDDVIGGASTLVDDQVVDKGFWSTAGDF